MRQQRLDSSQGSQGRRWGGGKEEKKYISEVKLSKKKKKQFHFWLLAYFSWLCGKLVIKHLDINRIPALRGPIFFALTTGNDCTGRREIIRVELVKLRIKAGAEGKKCTLERSRVQREGGEELNCGTSNRDGDGGLGERGGGRRVCH